LVNGSVTERWVNISGDRFEVVGNVVGKIIVGCKG